MARVMKGYRFVGRNEQGNFAYQEVKAGIDFNGFTYGQLLDVEKKKECSFLQVLVGKERKEDYWLDISWFKERGHGPRSLIERILNEYNDTNFPPQKTVGVKSAYCVDAVQWDFKLKPVKLGVHESIPIPEEDKPDYLLRKEGINYEHLAKTSLFTVNGFTHPVAYDTEGIYIRDGYQTALANKDINVGIISFEDISTLRIVDITEANLTQPIEDLSFLKAFFLTFPEEKLTNKNVAISIGGFLHFLTKDNKVVKKVGHNTLRIDSQEFHYHRRVKDVVKSLNRKHRLGMTPYDDYRWDNREIESIDTLKALLNLKQTFLVIFETNSPFLFEKRTLHKANYPRRYFDTKRHYPLLRLGDGRYPSYLLRDDKNGFVIATTKNTRFHKFDDTAPTHQYPFNTDYNRTTFEEEVQEGKFITIRASVTSNEAKNNYEGSIVLNLDD